jgi:alpha-maltose-1-phosphate synthase
MKSVIFYAYPPEPDGISLQGHMLMQGMRELGEDVMPCDPERNFQKQWVYKAYKPDVAIGLGFWGNTPDVVMEPMKHGITPVPWFNADGWVANYHDILDKLPLVVVNSRWVKETYIRDGLKGDNIEVLPIGVDPKIFHPIPKTDPGIVKIREMLGIKEDEKMILTMGGDVTSKGAQEMFHALAKINGQFPKWKYVCKTYESFSATDHGRDEKKLMKELKLDAELDKVQFLTGKFSHEFMAKLLNATDIYAGPSRLEGFGMIQQEASACGIPVIAIDKGGPRDTIIHNKTGFLARVEEEIKLDSEWAYKHMGFEHKQRVFFDNPKTFAYRANVDDLAEFTLKLLEDDELRKRMGEEGAKHILKNFHYRDIAKRMGDLIRDNVR